MDYCHQCRRHLNGALTCAGCGTAAEELRRRAPVPPEPRQNRSPGQDGRAAQDHEEFADAPESEIEPLVGHHPDRADRRGRPDRRRSAPARTGPRRARSKRGRRVLVGVLGVVLAAGALSLAQLALEPPGDDGASAVKEDANTEFDGRPDGTAKPVAPDDPGPTATRATGKGGSPVPGGSGKPGGTGSPDPGDSASSSDSPSPGDTGSADTGAPDSPASPDPSDSASGSGTPGGPTSGTPTATPTSPSPTPSSTPTESCTRILWWCA
ncbi:SCO2400 family protein [Streptomyces liangshanensis]